MRRRCYGASSFGEGREFGVGKWLSIFLPALHLPSDVYRQESIMVLEFGHTIWEMGVFFLSDRVAQQASLVGAYDQAMANGLWSQTHAATDWCEYWAIATQAWFNCGNESNPPDGAYNHVNTRAELLDYDPALASLLA